MTRVTLLLSLSFGCSPEIKDDWFTCDLAAGRGCPEGQSCVAGRCRTGGIDAGRLDAGAFDAGVFDAGSTRDAGPVVDPDAGPECSIDDDCGPSRNCCNGACTSIDSDPANCGRCDTDCDVCVMGACDPMCVIPADCNDGLDCTVETCDGMMCGFTVAEGTCFIDGACFANGDFRPGNRCQRCESERNRTDWTLLADMTACDSDGATCSVEACMAGTCRTQSILCAPCEQCEPRGCTPRADGDMCVSPDLPCSLATCASGRCVPTGECRAFGWRLDAFDNGANCSAATPTSCERCGTSGLPCCISYPSLPPRDACSGMPMCMVPVC